METAFKKDLQYVKFCAYGFFKNLRFFEPFLYLYFLEKGFNYLQIGTLIAVREVIRNILEIPSGVMSDVWGRRRTMIASFLVYILSFVTFFFANRYAMQIVAMVFFAVGDAFRTGTHKAMIFTWLEIHGWTNQKVNYYGHTRSWSQRGSAASSLLAAAVVFWFGTYKMVFLFSVIPYLFDLVLMMTYPKILEGPVLKKEKPDFLRETKKVVRQLFSGIKKMHNVQLIINTSMYGGFFLATKNYFQPVLASLATLIAVKISGISDAQMTALFVGGIYFLIYLSNATASVHSGRITRRVHGLNNALNITLLSGSLILLIAGILWLMPDPWKWSIILPFFLLYMFDNVRRPVSISVISERLPGDILATTLSLESQTRSFLAALFAPLLGYFVDKAGIGKGFIILAMIVLILFPLVRLRDTSTNKSGHTA